MNTPTRHKFVHGDHNAVGKRPFTTTTEMHAVLENWKVSAEHVWTQIETLPIKIRYPGLGPGRLCLTDPRSGRAPSRHPYNWRGAATSVRVRSFRIVRTAERPIIHGLIRVLAINPIDTIDTVTNTKMVITSRM